MRLCRQQTSNKYNETSERCEQNECKNRADSKATEISLRDAQKAGNRMVLVAGQIVPQCSKTYFASHAQSTSTNVKNTHEPLTKVCKIPNKDH